MKYLKITKGEVVQNKSIVPLTGINGEIEISSLDKSVDEWIALCHDDNNAEFIVEAFNITNQTGLTPSELLEQNGELMKALENIIEYIGKFDQLSMAMQNIKIQARKAIEKAKK